MNFWQIKKLQELKIILLNNVKITAVVKTSLFIKLLTGLNDSDGLEGEGDEDILYEGTSPQDQVIVLKSKIQQLEILCNDLKQELSYAKNESVHLNGLQSGIQSRLNEQDNSILKLKSEILQLNLLNEQLINDKNDLIGKLDERTRSINELKTELNGRNSTIDKLKSEISSVEKEREQNKYLKQQVKNFTDTLQMVKEKESTLANLIACTDRKLGLIDTKMTHQNMKKKFITCDEINVLKDSILKLRNTFKPNHPLQFIINTLEQGFFTIIDRVNSPITPQSPPGAASTQQQQQQQPSSASSSSKSSTSSTSSSTSNKNPPLPPQHYASTTTLHNNNNNNNTNIHKQISQPILLSNGLQSNQNQTKVLYYTDKGVTPYMTTISKK